MTPPPTGRTRRGLLVAATAATAGCGLLPDEPDPIEASAAAPARLPASAASEAGYERSVAEETTLEVSVTVDLSGDVQITNTREVVATVFRRAYVATEPRRFGLITAPAVTVADQPSIVRDPITALEDARAVRLTTGATVSSVSEWTAAGTRSMLDTTADAATATATTDGTPIRLDRVRVKTGDDAVTAIAVGPEGEAVDAPFAAVVHDG